MDEIACLVDFVDDHDVVARGVSGIVELHESLSAESMERQAAAMVEEFNRPEGV